MTVPELNVLGISKLYQYGKTQLPSDVRRKLQLKDGDRVYYIQDDFNQVYIKKAPTLEKRTGKYR